MCQENSDYTDCVIQCGDFSSDDSEEDHERNRYLISDVIQNIYNPASYAQISKYTYLIPKSYLIFRLRAHRLVLGSASGFLKNVFRDIPQTLPEATILVPGVKRNVCQALVIIMIYRVYLGYQNNIIYITFL